MEQELQNSTDLKPVEAVESCFEAARDLRSIIAKVVVAPTGLSMAEGDIIYAAHSIASGREVFQPISGGFALLDDILAVATYENYDAPKTTRILRNLADQGFVEIQKVRDLAKGGDMAKKVHGNSNCLKLTPEGVARAKQLVERYQALASHLCLRIPKEHLAIQTEVNRQLAQLVKGPSFPLYN
jgi:hypothetical protein